MPGPDDFDALARLGIAAGVLTAPATGSASTHQHDQQQPASRRPMAWA